MSQKYKPPEWAIKPPKSRNVYFEIVKDSSEIGKIDLSENTCTVFGRNPTMSDVILDHASISRQHSAVVHGRNSVFILDLGSVHGTFVGPSRLDAHTPTVLEEGCVVRFGGSTRAYVFKQEAAPPPPPPPPAPQESKQQSQAKKRYTEITNAKMLLSHQPNQKTTTLTAKPTAGGGGVSGSGGSVGTMEGLDDGGGEDSDEDPMVEFNTELNRKMSYQMDELVTPTTVSSSPTDFSAKKRKIENENENEEICRPIKKRKRGIVWRQTLEDVRVFREGEENIGNVHFMSVKEGTFVQVAQSTSMTPKGIFQDMITTSIASPTATSPAQPPQPTSGPITQETLSGLFSGPKTVTEQPKTVEGDACSGEKRHDSADSISTSTTVRHLSSSKLSGTKPSSSGGAAASAKKHQMMISLMDRKVPSLSNPLLDLPPLKEAKKK